MTIEPIGILTLIIGLIAVFCRPNFAMLAFVLQALLGASAAFLLGGSGSIQPAHVMLCFLLLVIFREPESFQIAMNVFAFPRQGFWLLSFAVYGLLSAYFFPRFFAGWTGINAIGSTAYEPTPLLVPLGPTSGNITQSIYLLADLSCFVAVQTYVVRMKSYDDLLICLLFYSLLNVIFAAVDLITAATNTGFLLDFIRNADYQLHTGEITGGFRRIVGSFVETSSFSYATIGSFAFTTRLWLDGYDTWRTGILSVFSFILLCSSTSSTAYASLFILLILLFSGGLWRAVSRKVAYTTVVFVVLLPPLVFLLLLTILINPETFSILIDLFETTVLDKATSTSGLERAQWNQTALQNFFDTFGVGGGLGSMRASSFMVALLSNIGIFGAAIFSIFFAKLFRTNCEKTDTQADRTVRAGARLACISLLVAASVSGALVDLGLLFYVFSALASARFENRI